MKTRRRVLPSGWYPDSARECLADIESFVQDFVPPPGKWLGGVAPHAGWYFSGRAAARVFKTLSGAGKVDRVVMYGGHLYGGKEPIVYTEEAWETPFGLIHMDKDLAGEMVSSGIASQASRSFEDNTVEVLLPFVFNTFPDTPLIAVHSPASERAMELGLAVQGMLADRNLTAVYVGSADLTHYGPNYRFNPKGSGAQAVKWVKEENDRSLIDKALAMDPDGVIKDAQTHRSTCSAGPIASVITSTGRHGVKSGSLLEYYTSFDVMPNASFVGYAAIVYGV
jgi:MEMO1 family protein